MENLSPLTLKPPCNWDVRTFVKDILAFANVQDGGYIVIGFNDGAFDRIGVMDEQAESFNQETMQDQVANYADPFVTFYVYNDIVDSDGLRFVVIRVIEFSEVPVLCKADSSDVHKGRMYYRSRHRRPESEAVSNSFDMRDISTCATVKMMAKRKSQGYTAETTRSRRTTMTRS